METFQLSRATVIPKDPLLDSSMDSLAIPGVALGHRLITAGDECAFFPSEVEAFARSVLKVRRASAAARLVARQLMVELGQKETALLKSISGAPIWPEGLVGSLAHDSRVAVAAMGLRRDLCALGIDIEPADSLPVDLLPLVATPRERRNIENDPYRGRMLFVAKEAVYKAIYPLEHRFLEHHDVEVDILNRKATVRNGRTIDLRFCVSTHLLVLAFIRKS